MPNPAHLPGSRARESSTAAAPLAPSESGAAGETFTPEQLARAARAQNMLYAAMVIFAFAPLVVWWLMK